jgi:PAS domain S-box-containing protein
VQEAHENLALILDHVGDGVTVQDPSGRLIYANAAAARSLGFASAAELLAAPLAEIVGRFTLYNEDGTPLLQEQLPGRRALAGEEDPSAAVRFHNHLTEEDRWSVIRASAVRDAEGNALFAVNVWQDATGQKHAEAAQRFLADAGAALSASLDVEATLTNIAQLAVPRLADWCAVHLVQADGTVAQLAVAHVDPERVAWALELQERYPSDPTADQGIYRALRTGQPEHYPEVTEDMLAASARDAEHLALLRRVGLTSAIAVPMIAGGRSVGVITFATAESGRRYDARDLELAQELAHRAALAVENARLYRAERLARLGAEEAQTRFRALFESVPDAILVADAEGRFIEANTAAGHLLGYEQNELLGIRFEETDADPDALRAHLAPLADMQAQRFEGQMRRKDGGIVPVELWARLLEAPAGMMTLLVVRDISERLAADQIREEVLTAISHDLRSPLGSIKLQAQVLQRALHRGGTPDPRRLDEGLSAIDALSTRVASLLDDVVDIARSRDDSGMPFSPEATDLIALARRCADEVRLATGREIHLDLVPDEVIGQWDPRGLERVALNLLNNAVKYSTAGSEITLHVTLDDEGRSQAMLAVKDAGIGIPAGDLPRVFDRYRRGRNVGQTGGTGLGLTGAKQIVERHGGAIEITSVEGQGTTVLIRLPLETRDPQAAP